MAVFHNHHLLPRHAGGTNHPSNILKVTVEEHAELHFARYLELGELGDWLAAYSLSGQITHSDASSQARADWIARNPKHHSNAGKKGGLAPASDFAKAVATETARSLGKLPWWNDGQRNARCSKPPGTNWTKGRLGFKINQKPAKVTCSHCGIEMVPSNLSRHIQSKHQTH